MKYEKMIQSLEHNGYKVSFFETSAATVKYIFENVSGVTVGFGDSATLVSLNLAELLSEHNSVVDPVKYSGLEFNEMAQKTLTTDVLHR